jgi:hypothetical protein
MLAQSTVQYLCHAIWPIVSRSQARPLRSCRAGTVQNLSCCAILRLRLDEEKEGKKLVIFALEIVSCEREGDNFWGEDGSFWVQYIEPNAP